MTAKKFHIKSQQIDKIITNSVIVGPTIKGVYTLKILGV